MDTNPTQDSFYTFLMKGGGINLEQAFFLPPIHSKSLILFAAPKDAAKLQDWWHCLVLMGDV